MSLIQRFKKTNPQEERAQAEKRSKTGSVGGYSVFKDGILPYKFEEGSNLLRLLPQLDTSPFPSFLEINVLGFYDESLPIRGTFRVMDEHQWVLSRAYKLLRAHPEFKHRLWSKENELGLSFNARPKVVFLGFNINDPELKVIPMVLPGTVAYPAKDGKARIPQAGTRITQFIYDQDIHGNVRYGDIFGVEEGRVIRLDVTNAGTIRVRYEPVVDAVYPLTSDRYEKVLTQIQDFDAYVKEPKISELVKVLSAYIPADMFEYLDGQINFDRVIEQAGEVGQPKPTTETPNKAASVPLPVEADDSEDELANFEPATGEAAKVEEKLAQLRKEMLSKRTK